MPTYEQLSKQMFDLIKLAQSGGSSQFIEALHNFEVAFNQSRDDLKAPELRDLDRKFAGLVEGVLESYVVYKEQLIQQERERGETPPNDTQVGECVENQPGFYKDQYPGFRSIRGDGNCYYRAVMVGLIEQIILSPDKERLFLDLGEKFERLIGTFEERYDDIIIPFIVALTEASQGHCWATVEDFDDELRRPDSRLDAQMIQSARCLNAHTCKRWVPEGFFIEEDMPNILKMGEEAEGVSIQTLPKELGITFDLVWPQEHRVEKYSPDSTHCFGDTPGRFKVSLLYTNNPGHYDLLYAPEQYQQLQSHHVFEPIQAETSPVVQLIENYIYNFYNHSPQFENAKTALFDYIRGCPANERELIHEQMKACFSNLDVVGHAENMNESFFVRLRENTEAFERLFVPISSIAPPVHRSSIFRPEPEDYRTFLQLILLNPIANEEHFNHLFEHLKTLSPADLEHSMKDIHDKIDMLKNTDKSAFKVLKTALKRFDFQVQEMCNPEGLAEFRENLKHYVRALQKDPQVAREALLESIIMFPAYVQKSLHSEVNDILVSLAKKHPQITSIIGEEFKILGNFISTVESPKMRK